MLKPELMIYEESKTEKNLNVYAPFDRKIIGKVPQANFNLIDKALTTAHNLYLDKNNWLSIVKRITIFENLIALMQKQSEELIKLAASEGGKPLIDTKIEVFRAIDAVKSCIVNLRSEQGRVIPMNMTPYSANRIAHTKRMPIGVVVAFSAFNHPLNLIVRQVAAAIAAGNPVIIKPASNTPLTCCKFVELLYKAGLDKNWSQVVIPEDHDLAEKLATDSRVAYFNFIGSAKVGWYLRSKLAPGTRCALEHGGVAPVIIEKDANLEIVIDAILKGSFYHAGQVCVSVQRIFIEQNIAREVSHELAKRANELKVGSPLHLETEVGPLIEPKETTRIHKWVTESLQAGGDLLSGGEANGETLYQPTVVYNPPDDSILMQQEIFGPVVCVKPYKNIEQAIYWANNVPYAFQGAVFTENLNTALHVFQQLEASAVMVNDHSAFNQDNMPFGGIKVSGLGMGGIAASIQEMQIEKMLVLHSKAIL